MLCSAGRCQQKSPEPNLFPYCTFRPHSTDDWRLASDDWERSDCCQCKKNFTNLLCSWKDSCTRPHFCSLRSRCLLDVLKLNSQLLHVQTYHIPYKHACQIDNAHSSPYCRNPSLGYDANQWVSRPTSWMPDLATHWASDA